MVRDLARNSAMTFHRGVHTASHFTAYLYGDRETVLWVAMRSGNSIVGNEAWRPQVITTNDIPDSSFPLRHIQQTALWGFTVMRHNVICTIYMRQRIVPRQFFGHVK